MPNIFMLLKQTAFVFIAILALSSCSEGAKAPEFDVIISNGTVYDGSGGAPFVADIGIEGDRITAIGDLDEAYAITVVDATGMAVSPGFINMLSWAPETLMVNGAGLSDLKQGITLEVFGEGWSYGPWSDAMKEEILKRQTDFKYQIEWTTLGEYLDFMEARGIAMNIASFVGATTLRIHEIGYQDRPATEQELAAMQDLVREAMAEGALGVGSALIYAPANFANTEELIALASAAGEYDGMYISHMRSESGQIF